MTGARIAVFGLARSGLAIAKAALAKGAHPTVYDEKPEQALAARPELAEARRLGVALRLGWAGEFADDRPDLVVTSPGVPMRHPKLQSAARAGVEVISEVEFAYRISRAPIVAITGTNGKSTTTVMTWLALKGAGVEAVLCGNIAGSGYDEEVPLTEAALASQPHQALVAEVSSFQLEWIKEFRPAAAGITNITPDHLDRYESFEEYAATKMRIFENQGPEEFAVIRAHDPVVSLGRAPRPGRAGRRPQAARSEPAVPGAGGPQVLTFGATSEDARVEEDHLVLFGQKIPWSELPIHEPHNRTNAAMACLLAYALLLSKAAKDPRGAEAAALAHAQEEAAATRRSSVFGSREVPTLERRPAVPAGVIEGLRRFRGLAHRMELLGERNGVKVVNNSMCTNPDAVLKSATSTRENKHLLLGGTNKKLDFRPLRSFLANGQNKAYIFGRDAEQVNDGLGGGFPVFATMEEAFRAAAAAARPGETIMLAPGCASQDQFDDFRHRGNVFREIAKEWLDA